MGLGSGPRIPKPWSFPLERAAFLNLTFNALLVLATAQTRLSGLLPAETLKVLGETFLSFKGTK